MDCIMEDDVEFKTPFGATTPWGKEKPRRATSELLARRELWKIESLAHARTNISTLVGVLKEEIPETVSALLRKTHPSLAFGNLTRKKMNGDTLRYHHPATGDLILDIRPDSKIPDGKQATLYDTDGYPYARLAIRSLPLRIDGFYEEDAALHGIFDAIEKITFYKHHAPCPSRQDRQEADRSRTLRLKFAREAKESLGFSPWPFKDGRTTTRPEPDQIEVRATFKFKLPCVIFGQEELGADAYTLKNRLSSSKIFTPSGMLSTQYAGNTRTVQMAPFAGQASAPKVETVKGEVLQKFIL